VEGLGSGERRLAEKLRGLVQDYDMDAVLKTLAQVELNNQWHE
jgi:hypothetical protein